MQAPTEDLQHKAVQQLPQSALRSSGYAENKEADASNANTDLLQQQHHEQQFIEWPVQDWLTNAANAVETPADMAASESAVPSVQQVSLMATTQ